MNRFTSENATTMEFSFWLVFDRDGGVRMVRGEPVVARNERAMAVSARLPKSLFRTPSLHATITLASDEAPASFEIDAAAVADALKGAVGMDIDLVIRQPLP